MACPSSCVMIVWKSYWSAPITDGSAPVYQFQPVTSVIWPAVVQPSTPSAALPAGLVLARVTWMTASEACPAPISTRVTPNVPNVVFQVFRADWNRASSAAVTFPAELSRYTPTAEPMTSSPTWETGTVSPVAGLDGASTTRWAAPPEAA